MSAKMVPLTSADTDGDRELRRVCEGRGQSLVCVGSPECPVGFKDDLQKHRGQEHEAQGRPQPASEHAFPTMVWDGGLIFPCFWTDFFSTKES